MDGITHRTLRINCINMHIAEQGTGPLVLLLHGFPCLWYSWRHQIRALAAAGFHAVAPDLRGFGETDAPEDVSKYTSLHMVGDVVGLMRALGDDKPVHLVGHDWGAAVGWYTALLRPDLVRSLAALAIAFLPRDPNASILDNARAAFGDGVFLNQWQEPEKPEADLNKQGVRMSLLKIYTYNYPHPLMATQSKTVMENIEVPECPPPWLTEEDLQYYIDAFEKTGFTGGLNWYRNFGRSWELMAPWSGKGISKSLPTFVLLGDEDMNSFQKGYMESSRWDVDVPNSQKVYLPGIGHFLPEEVPEIVNDYVINFIKQH